MLFRYKKAKKILIHMNKTKCMSVDLKNSLTFDNITLLTIFLSRSSNNTKYGCTIFSISFSLISLNQCYGFSRLILDTRIQEYVHEILS